MVAMCAARVGEPERAVDALLLDTPKNHYRLNGHNHQRPGLTIYLPGNGGLLYAVAMMAAGWDGATEEARSRFSRQRSVDRALGRIEAGCLNSTYCRVDETFPSVASMLAISVWLFCSALPG